MSLPKYRNPHHIESQEIVVSRSVYFKTSASGDADCETDGEGSGYASTSGAAQLYRDRNLQWLQERTRESLCYKGLPISQVDDIQPDVSAKERRKRKRTEDEAPATYGSFPLVQLGEVTLSANYLALLARLSSDKH